MAEAWERNLGIQIWNARTADDAKQIIQQCIERFGAKPIAIGRENNIGTINMASDPGLALVERLTNGIDSRMELAVRQSPGVTPTSPEAAAQRFFDIPANGLGDMTESERRELATGLRVGMHESGYPKRPTIRVTDTGVGQHPSSFAQTLLSLNENNKVDLDYTMGTFGQGGSATLSYSKYVVFCSRRHPSCLETDQDDRVGFTVAYEEETDPNVARWPRYVWLIAEDGSPLSLPVNAFPDLANGTRITHIEYDTQGLEAQFTTQMWQFLNNCLFSPVLPFILEGDRTESERKADSRVILGNAARLAQVDKARGQIEIAAEDTHKIDLPGYGSVIASWWVLDRPAGSTSRSDPADSYAKADSSVVMTLHGQRQATKPRAWLKNTTKLPFLYKHIIVHINTDGLNGAGRREVYASTRERARNSDLSKQIFDDVAQLIREDVELKRLNRLKKEEKRAESSQAANEKVRKRLSKFVKTKLKENYKSGKKRKGASGDGPEGGRGTDPGDDLGKKKRKGGNRQARLRDDSHLGNVPTSLAFDAKALRVVQGFSTTMWVDIDAKNGYLPEHDDDLEIRILGAKEGTPFVKSRSRLQGGRSSWKIAALSETAIGTYELSATLMTANGRFSASVPLEVVQPSKPNKTGKGGREEETGPEIRWVKRDQWDDVGGQVFTERTVGTVTEDDESTVLFVNQDFAPLVRSFDRSSEDTIRVRRDRYLYPVACGLWLQHYENQQITGDNGPSDEYLEGEIARLAEAVIVAIDPDVQIADAEAED